MTKAKTRAVRIIATLGMRVGFYVFWKKDYVYFTNWRDNSEQL